MDNASQQLPNPQVQNPPASPVEPPKNLFLRNFFIFFAIAVLIALLGTSAYLVTRNQQPADTEKISEKKNLNPNTGNLYEDIKVRLKEELR